MKIQEINKKQCLVAMIALLFALTAGFIIWNQGAINTQRDLRLKIDTMSWNQEMDYKYRTIRDFSIMLMDSIIQEGYSDGKYIVFDINKEGYDVPLFCSRIPNFFHPSVKCKLYHDNHVYGNENFNNINRILPNSDVKRNSSTKYIERHFLRKAMAAHSEICVILPSYDGSMKKDIYSPIFEDFEIDGRRMSEMTQEMEQHPQEVVDSLMNDILHAIEAYCQSEHCNVGKGYVYILKGCVNSEMRDAFNHYIKLPQGEKAIEEWLVAHKGRIKESYHQYDEVHNAVRQLLTNEEWMEDKENEGIDVLWIRNFLKQIAE